MCVQGSVDHPCLDDVVAPLKELREKVRTKALMRLKYEGKQTAGPLTDPSSKWYQRPKDYAEDLYAYYECFKCKVRALSTRSLRRWSCAHLVPTPVAAVTHTSNRITAVSVRAVLVATASSTPRS